MTVTNDRRRPMLADRRRRVCIQCRRQHLRSYLSTTRKNDVSAIDALTRLFNGDPWMPPQPT